MFFSLKRNLLHLFVFEDFSDFNIPYNEFVRKKCDDVKRKLDNHHGMNKDNNILFIKDFLSFKYDK